MLQAIACKMKTEMLVSDVPNFHHFLKLHITTGGLYLQL